MFFKFSGTLQAHINSSNLTINKEHLTDDRANVLNLSFCIENSKFNVSVFGTFPFAIVQFAPCMARMPRKERKER